jgi:high affinity choline transporter 7
MLMLGGIPWNCYFQRVLSCRSPRDARWHSFGAGVLTMVLTLPPFLIGLAAAGYPWPSAVSAQLSAQPADAMPLVFRHITPPMLGLFGLAAIMGAVTSSFSASILSAAAMFSWNTWTRLLRPGLSLAHLKRVMRLAILGLAAGAVVLALEVQSVQALWFFTSDLVFVLLFPQLVYALFDAKTNLAGSVTAFSVSLLLRLGGGEPLFGIPPLLPYAEMAAVVLPLDPAAWYDAESGALLLPYKSFAAGVGMLVIPVVSRLTASWSTARPLQGYR